MVWITNITPKPFWGLWKFLNQYVTVEIFKNGDQYEPRLISGQVCGFDDTDQENPTLLLISRSGAYYTLHSNMHDKQDNKDYWFLNRMSAPPGMDNLEEGVVVYSVPQILHSISQE